MPPRFTPVQGQIFRSLSHSTPTRGRVCPIQLINYCAFLSKSHSPRSCPINRGINTDASPRTSSVFYQTDIKCSDRLKDRACVITGGSSGIGYAIAERFLHEGAGKVVIIGRNKKRLLAAMEKLQLSLSGSTVDRGTGSQEPTKNVKESGENQEISQDACEIIEFSPRIEALAGDVGLSKFWASAPCKTALVRPLPYELSIGLITRIPNSSGIVDVNEVTSKLTSLVRHRCPRQRRRGLTFHKAHAS